MSKNKKRPVEGKHPIELTADEVLESVFSKEVLDKLKEIARRGRRHGKRPPHE